MASYRKTVSLMDKISLMDYSIFNKMKMNYSLDFSKKTPKKTPESVPVTKLDEEMVAQDTSRFFKEIVKNTASTSERTELPKQSEERKTKASLSL